MPKFCSECGNKFGDNPPKFCGECGAKVTQESAPVSASTTTTTTTTSVPVKSTIAPPAKKTTSAPREQVRMGQQAMPWEKEAAAKKTTVNDEGKESAVNAQSHDGHFGLTAEAKKKVADKYDAKLEADVRSWISGHVSSADWSQGFAEGLKSGLVLCELVNDLRPGLIKGHKNSKMAFVQMENIAKFLKACTTLGIRDSDRFMTVDLFEQKNMTQVLQCLAAVRIKFPN